MLKAKIKKEKIGRIGVLMGGPSTERDISLKSGKAVYHALKEQGLDVVPLEITDNSWYGISKHQIPLRKSFKSYREAIFLLKKIKQAKISCAFVALHGKFGEDGTIQRFLESLDLPYTGSAVLASYLCLDKIASRRIFKQYDIPVPEYDILNHKSWRRDLSGLKLKFPVVVKPSSQGSSIGITFVDNRRNLTPALKLAFQYDQEIIIEKYIRGREITVGILRDKALPIVEIIPKKRFFDFQAKYEKGKSDYVVPAKILKKHYQRAQRIGLLAYKVLGCRGFSRVDMILGKAGPIVLEVNSIPGLTSSSLLPMAAEAVGVTFGELCLKIVQSALKEGRRCPIIKS